MTLIRTTTRVDSDGNIIVPVGANEAGKEVVVTVAPAPNLSQAQWEQLIDHTAGSIDDPTFVRPEQGAHEKREPLE